MTSTDAGATSKHGKLLRERQQTTSPIGIDQSSNSSSAFGGECSSSSSSLNGTTTENSNGYINNIVRLTIEPFLAPFYVLQEFRHTILDFDIAYDQDPDQEIAIGQTRTGDRQGRIRFPVGRARSSTVASWWQRHFTYRDTTFDDDPRELYFGFVGKLEIDIRFPRKGNRIETFVLQNVGLGQGPTKFSDVTWWFAVPGAVRETRTSDTLMWEGMGSGGSKLSFTFWRGINRGIPNAANEVDIFAVAPVSL